MNNLISILLIVASIGFFFGYVNPTYGALTQAAELHKRSIAELKEEEARYIDALNKTKEIEQARTGLLEEYARIPAEGKERLEKLLPDNIDSVRLIIDVNNIASQYEMTLKNISLTESTSSLNPTGQTAIGPSEERFKATGLKFSVAGSYDNFRSFIRDLEQSLRLVDIETVVFNAPTEVYEYAVTVSTYRLNPPTARAF